MNANVKQEPCTHIVIWSY